MAWFVALIFQGKFGVMSKHATWLPEKGAVIWMPGRDGLNTSDSSRVGGGAQSWSIFGTVLPYTFILS